MIPHMMEQAHPRKARLRNLSRADRVIDGGRLAPTARIIMGFAHPVVHEVGFHPVRLAEVEMAAVRDVQQAARTQIGIIANAIHIGPEVRPRHRHLIARQISLPRHEGRREAEIESEQRRRFGSRRDQPFPNSATGPEASAIRMDKPGHSIATLAQRHRYPLVPHPLRARPIDRGITGEARSHSPPPRSARSLSQ